MYQFCSKVVGCVFSFMQNILLINVEAGLKTLQVCNLQITLYYISTAAFHNYAPTSLHTNSVLST